MVFPMINRRVCCHFKILLIKNEKVDLYYTFRFFFFDIASECTETNWSLIIIYKTIQGISCKCADLHSRLSEICRFRC